jgi:hypothetical protein
MALVRSINNQKLEKDSRHTEVDCTSDIITDETGNKCLQLDTYGSKQRKIPELIDGYKLRKMIDDARKTK